MAQRQRSVHLDEVVTKLRRIRMAKGITQKQLGPTLKPSASQGFISVIEARRTKKPTYQTLARIAEALGYELEIILKPK